MEHVDLSEAFADSVEEAVDKTIAEQAAEKLRPLEAEELAERVRAHRAQLRKLIEDRSTLAVLLVVTSGSGLVMDLGHCESASDVLTYLDDPAVTGGLAFVAGKGVAVLSFGLTANMAAAAARVAAGHVDFPVGVPTVDPRGCAYTAVSFGLEYEDRCLAVELFLDFNRQSFNAGAVRPRPLATIGG